MELQNLDSRKGSLDGSIHSVHRPVSNSKVGSNGVPSLNGEGPSRTSNSAEIPITYEQKTVARVQFLTLCWTLFLAGWNDGTTGPLLPRIQEVYHVCFSNHLTQFCTLITHFDQ